MAHAIVVSELRKTFGMTRALDGLDLEVRTGEVHGFLGPVLQLPDWTMDLSPFTHVPEVPSADLKAWPLLQLTAVAAALIAVGLAAFRYRDVG